jgi:hypothetical protein
MSNKEFFKRYYAAMGSKEHLIEIDEQIQPPSKKSKSKCQCQCQHHDIQSISCLTCVHCDEKTCRLSHSKSLTNRSENNKQQETTKLNEEITCVICMSIPVPNIKILQCVNGKQK